MTRTLLTGVAVALFGLAIGLPVHAQEAATLVLRNGERQSGELVDLGGSGFAMRVGGQDRTFPANDVAAVEFVGGALPPTRRRASTPGRLSCCCATARSSRGA